MAHDAATYATSAQQRRSPAETKTLVSTTRRNARRAKYATSAATSRAMYLARAV